MTNWIYTVSPDHVGGGVRGRFTQANHGKPNMLQDGAGRLDRLLLAEDRSPRRRAVAGLHRHRQVADDEPYQVQMSDDFQPWRRNVDFLYVPRRLSNR